MKRAFYYNALFEGMTQQSKAISSTALRIWGKQKPGVMDTARHSCLEMEEQFLVQGHMLRVVLQTEF